MTSKPEGHSSYKGALSQVATGFLVFRDLVVHDLPQLPMHTVVFSSL